MANTSRSVAVLGLGSFGGSVARELARFGDHVLGVDTSETCVDRYSDLLYRTVIADTRDERAMEEVGLGQYDAAVVAMASDLESSVLSCMNARQAGVAEIWAKAGSRTHALILESIGVDRVVQPEHEYGEHIANMLHNAAMQEYIRLAPQLHLASIRVGAEQGGKRLGDLKLLDRFELRCLGLVRDDAYLNCSGELELADGDSLLVIGSRERLRVFAEKL